MYVNGRLNGNNLLQNQKQAKRYEEACATVWNSPQCANCFVEPTVVSKSVITNKRVDEEVAFYVSDRLPYAYRINLCLRREALFLMVTGNWLKRSSVPSQISFIISQRSICNHHASRLNNSMCNYDNKWCKSGVRGSWNDLMHLFEMSIVGVQRGSRNYLIFQISALVHFQHYIFLWLCSFGTDIMKGLVTDSTALNLLWLSLCAPRCIGTQGDSLDTQTTE